MLCLLSKAMRKSSYSIVTGSGQLQKHLTGSFGILGNLVLGAFA